MLKGQFDYITTCRYPGFRKEIPEREKQRQKIRPKFGFLEEKTLKS